MRTLELADGRTFPAPLCGASAGILVIFLDSGGAGIADLVDIFTNPDVTRTVIWHYGNMTDVHEGYTHLHVMALDDAVLGATIRIALKREEASA